MIKSDAKFPMRLNKYLAHAGFATRRSADTLINEGGVFVNGKRAEIGQKVSEHDRVEVRHTSPKKFQYIIYYKPYGIASHTTEKNEQDAVTKIKRDHKISGIFPIGRLDKSTEGLIILTDDGRITGKLLEGNIEQEYEVQVDKRLTQTFINRIEKGVRIDGHMTGPAHTAITDPDNHVFSVTLSEGRNHHIRRMCATLGYAVTGLKRTRIGYFSLKKLKPGEFHRLTEKEIAALKKRFKLQ